MLGTLVSRNIVRLRHTQWPCPPEDYRLVGVRQRSEKNNYISWHRSKLEERARKLWVNHRAISSSSAPLTAAQKVEHRKVQQWRLASVSAFILTQYREITVMLSQWKKVCSVLKWKNSYRISSWLKPMHVICNIHTDCLYRWSCPKQRHLNKWNVIFT